MRFVDLYLSFPTPQESCQSELWREIYDQKIGQQKLPKIR